MPTIPILPNIYEGPPEINRDRISQEEKPQFLHVIKLLAELNLYEREFLQAVYLYDYCQTAAQEIEDFATLESSLWTITGWQMMAARDGALTIYHFGRTAEGLKSSLSRCPSLNSQVDHQILRNSRNRFDAAFPDNIEIRASVAHVADFSQSLDKKMKHAIKGVFNKGRFLSKNPDGTTWLPGNMNERSYTVTINGRVCSYDLSHENAARLREIKKQIYSAFDAATTVSPSA